MPCVSVVVSSDFCRFKLALPSLLSMSKDEVKAAHSDFDLGPRGGDLRPENPPDRHFFNGSSRNLTPSHTTRDAFMNSSLAFSRDVSLGRL